jgi:hypothetical protein
MIVGLILNILKAGEISRIGEGIQVVDLVLRVAQYKPPDYM